MTACERCWEVASMRAFMSGGVAADYYQQVLTENDERCKELDSDV